MACANLSFHNHATLRSIPAPCHVLLDASVPALAPSVYRKSSKCKSKTLVVIQAGNVEPQSRPYHGYQVSIGTTKLPSFVTSIDNVTRERLPPLVQSMVIEGISPHRELPAHVVAAAHDRMASIAARSWPGSQSTRTRFVEYCRLGLSISQFYFPEADLDRTTAMATIFAVMFLIDDVFDSPCDRSSLVADYGLDPAMSWEFLRALDELLRQDDPPLEPCSPIHRIMWDVGQEMRRMSTPGFLNFFVDAVQEHHRVVLARRADQVAGACECLRSLDSYTAMRVGDSGGLFSVAFSEFANGEFLPDDVRVHPFTAELTGTAIAHALLVNDIFSYSKEVLEENPYNVIPVLMESRQIPLAQAAWQAVEVVNSYHGVVMAMQRRLKVWEPVKGSRAPLLKYLSRVRDLYSGNIFWSSLVRRYRVADAVFSELRGCPHPHEILQRM